MITYYLVQLEPLDNRYTEEWSRWFPKKFKEKGLKYRIIEGKLLTNKIEKGEFLDIDGTTYFKASQVMEMAKLFHEGKIKNNDVFFFYDLWDFAVTALKYEAQLQDLDIKICGVMHAGSYIYWDFITQKGVELWAKYAENCWLEIADMIFVGSKYHKDILCKMRTVNPDKIYVTGLPLDVKEIRKLGGNPKKEDIVVFPHRLAQEKAPEIFDRISKMERFKDFQFIRTKDLNLTKSEYYKLLAKCKVIFSSSLEETYGYGTLEAITLGCVPVVPNRLCYKDMYPEKYRYKTIEQACDLIEKYMKKPDVPYKIAEMYSKSIDRIIRKMEEKFGINCPPVKDKRAICNKGYACDGCPDNPDKLEEVKI